LQVFVEQLLFRDNFATFFWLIDKRCWRGGYLRLIMNDYSQLSEDHFRRVFDGSTAAPRRLLFLGTHGMPLRYMRAAFGELAGFRGAEFIAVNVNPAMPDGAGEMRFDEQTVEAMAGMLVEPVGEGKKRVVCVNRAYLSELSFDKVFGMVEKVGLERSG
jgi:hypothetical protein